MTYIDPLTQIARGSALVDNMFTQQAQRQAGSRLRSRDYNGAAGALLDNGQLEAGLAIQNAGRTQQQADATRQWEFTVKATNALEGVLAQGGDVVAAYDQLAPVFQQMGMTPEQIQALRAPLSANPQQFLQAVKSTVPRELQIENLGEGTAVAIDERTGDEVRRYTRPRLPQRVAVGDDYIEVAEDGTVRPLYQGAQDPEYIKLSNSDGTETLTAVGGRDGGVVAPAPRASGGGADALEVISSLIPDVRFTSGLRTPDQNRSAGGAPNSFHLRGQAVDIAPPAGVSIQDFRRQLESQGVNVRELINEGDHWHIAWEGGSRAPNVGRGEPVRPANGGVRVIAQGANNGPTPAAARAEAREARVTDRQSRQDSRQLRRDFEALPDVKDYRTVETAYNQVVQLSRNSGNPADDVALTFSFMKMLDPGSVVREGEYALVGRAQGLTGRALVALQRIDSGEALTPELRADLRQTAARVLESRRQRYNAVAEQYRGYAQEDGFDPDRVVPLVRGSTQSGRRTTPGLPFEASPGQLQTRQRLAQSGATPSAPVGSERNPRYMNPQDPNASWANARSGDYIVRPDGRMVRKP